MSNKVKKVFGPYSPVRLVGQTAYISGQVGVDPDTKSASNDIQQQTQQVLINLKRVLAEAGLDLANVVKTTIYLVDMADFEVVNQVYGSYFSEPYPARACVEVAGLPRVVGETRLLVEIEAVAQGTGGLE